MKGLFHRMEKKQEVQEEIPFPQEMPPMPPEMPPQRPENIWANTPNEGGWDNPPEENRKTYPSPGEGFGEDPGRGYEPDPASGFGEDPAGGYEPDPTPGFWDKPAGGYNPDPMPGNDGAQGRGYTPNPTSGFGEEQRKSFTPNPGTGFASDDDDGNDATVMLRDDGSEATILLKARVKPNATLIRLHTQEKFHITTEICKIGKRALMVDICIRNNPTISREHCAIHFEEGKYYLEDKDSSNYTYLNGNRAMPGQKLLLNDGDQIRLSDEEFIFRKGDVK